MTAKSSPRRKTAATKAAQTPKADNPNTDTPQENDLGDLDFEAALAELDTVVARMESGDLSLEDSLSAFERGIRLTRHCQSALESAELRVRKLTADGKLEDLTEFDDQAASDD